MRPSPRLLLLGLLLAVLVTGAVVVAGTLTADDGPEAPDEERFAPTALQDFDTEEVAVRRASFCAAIDPRQVEAALGAAPESERSWDNGDRVKVSDGVRDVVHEYGCEYAAGGTTARAWVFAPPVDLRRAKQLVKKLPRGPAVCTDVPSPPFGDPSTAWSCAGQGETVSIYRGLLGEAWLSCELRTSQVGADPTELHERAGSWCVAVAMAGSAENTVAG